ncbi:hypothetical protein [Bradyrhizobium lablabi]|uniref:hypothetical protein n=1 Tax=Bradyrhizobium lablabi TaxID=722472 RepID=UPI001BA9679A|nr:hypothetical protein [Bradyrhizobium lablabi]MBR0697780.1 hypothetical protein [Bradyrhizobium lablabi]
MTHLVMGFATNISEASLRVFSKSLRAVYSPSECDLVIITNRFESFFVDIAKSGVRFAPTSNNYNSKTGNVSKAINRSVLHALRMLRKSLTNVAPEIAESYPALIENWHHPHFVRWFAYERFLTLNRHYDQVMLSDVKDVVFQAPFFANHEKVCLCDQGLVYGETYWDTEWYRSAFGQENLNKVLGKSPLCIGTMMGPHASVLGIVRELCAEFAERPFNRIEQAVFNHLLLNNQVKTPYQILPNITGPIVTLCSDDIASEFHVNDGVICRNVDKSIAPVIHMYDRFHPMHDEVKQRWMKS